jgi:hypothetical protein
MKTEINTLNTYWRNSCALDSYWWVVKMLSVAIFVENSSKTKINKLIDFIDNEYVDNVNTDSIVNIT